MSKNRSLNAAKRAQKAQQTKNKKAHRKVQASVSPLPSDARDTPLLSARMTDPLIKLAAMEAKGVGLCAYLIALAAWQRGLAVTFYYQFPMEVKRFDPSWKYGYRGELFSVTDGKSTHYFSRSMGDLSDRDAVRLIDKHESKKIFAKAGVQVPQGRIFDQGQIQAVEAYLSKSSKTYVIKPLNGSQGKGVYADLTPSQLLALLPSYPYQRFLIEEFIQGTEYRCFVVGQQCIAAYRRTRPFIIGDGQSSIQQLINQKNKQRKTNPNLYTKLIKTTSEVIHYLEQQGLTLTSILAPHQLIYLSSIANISLGGETEDITAILPEPVKRNAILAVKAAQLPNAGVDIIVPDNDPESAGYVLELNQRAHIGGLSFPGLGDFNNRAAEALIDHYFPHSRQLIQHPLAHFSFDAIKQALASPWVNQVTLQTLRPDHQHWRGSISTQSHLDELKRQLNRERLRYRLFSLGKDSLWIDALITPKQHAFLQKLDVNQGKNLYQIKGDEPDTQLESILDQDPANLLTPLLLGLADHCNYTTAGDQLASPVSDAVVKVLSAPLYHPACRGASFPNNYNTQMRILRRAAYAKGFAVEMPDLRTTIIHHQGKRHAFYQGMSDCLSLIARRATNDKAWTKRLLNEVGIDTPQGKIFLPQSVTEAWSFARQLGLPVVIKPLVGSGGKGVSTHIHNEEHFKRAWTYACESKTSKIIVESCHDGNDYRVVIVGDSLVAAAQRIPAHVVGDGVHSIEELVDIKNKQRKSSLNPYHSANPITLTASILNHLAGMGLSLASILPAGKRVLLQRVANIGGGGESVDVTDQVHPNWAAIGVKARQAMFDAPHIGLDLIAEDIALPPKQQRWAIIEVNTNPDFGVNHFPMHGEGRDVAGVLLDYLFGSHSKPEQIALLVTISGKVQGVGYRQWAWKAAHLRSLSGWVANETNGQVKMLLVGAKSAVEDMLTACRSGSPKAKVSDVTYLDWQNERPQGFEIISSPGKAPAPQKPRHPSKLKQPDLSQGFSYSNSGDIVLKIGE